MRASLTRAALLLSCVIGAAALPAAAQPAPAPHAGHAAPIAPAGATQSHTIPFVTAEVTRDGADGAYQVRWSAPGAGRVTVHAATDPAAGTQGRRVGIGGADATIRIGGLAPGQRWYFTLAPASGAPLTIALRSLDLATSPNFRDLGGYRTEDGRWVQMGLLFRSDQLNRLSDADLARAGTLGIGTVGDLRTTAERTREADRLPAGSTEASFNVMADDEASGDMRAVLQIVRNGGALDYADRIYRDFVRMPSAQSAYARLAATVAGGAGGTLYHCTAGKDRTGWASAVILSLLGVPRETIYADYLASSGYLADKNAATLAAMHQADPTLDPTLLEPLLGVRREFLAASFNEVEQRYGSFDAYRRTALGIDDATVERLRARYLAGAPAPTH